MICFFIFLSRSTRRSVHSARITSIRRDLRPFGETYVHSAAFRSIRRKMLTEWTDFIEKLVCRVHRNSTAKLRPFGECLVHSAKTASTLEQNACIAYVHSADTYVHSANYVHSAPSGPRSEALGLRSTIQTVYWIYLRGSTMLRLLLLPMKTPGSRL